MGGARKTAGIFSDVELNRYAHLSQVVQAPGRICFFGNAACGREAEGGKDRDDGHNGQQFDQSEGWRFCESSFHKKRESPALFAGGRGPQFELAFSPAQQGQEGGAAQKQGTGRGFRHQTDGDVGPVSRESCGTLRRLQGIVGAPNEEGVIARCQTGEVGGDESVRRAVADNPGRIAEVGRGAVGGMTDVGERGEAGGDQVAAAGIAGSVVGRVVADGPVAQGAEGTLFAATTEAGAVVASKLIHQRLDRERGAIVGERLRAVDRALLDAFIVGPLSQSREQGEGRQEGACGAGAK